MTALSPDLKIIRLWKDVPDFDSEDTETQL